MVASADIAWFKANFAAPIRAAVAGSVFDIDMLCAIACQETGSLWAPMRRAGMGPTKVAALCCGDTLDADKGRSAFPRTKADLLAVPNGPQMFDIGRAALLAMADHVPGYEFARTNKAKFCHGYGVFQYDLQFFLKDPAYFLERKYEIFENSLAHALKELTSGLKKLKLHERPSITDLEFCAVAIAYNTGGFKPERGLKQGHSDNGKFYGEFIRDFLAMSRAVPTPGAPAVTPPPPGTTPLPDPGAITAGGPLFHVQIASGIARLRSEPKISNPKTANVRAELPDGHAFQSVSATANNGFIEGEALLGGKVFHGFVSETLLKRSNAAMVAELAADAVAPAAVIPEAVLANSPGNVTKRTGIADAVPLNEPNMPVREASDPAGLRADLAAIIEYLAPDNPSFKRYKPRDGLTFCNIYAHDYCRQAGAYLPRVWWTQPALLRIAGGEAVTAKLSNTVDEMRANDLFRWLRDFGQNFGWRRAASVTELQNHANMGGVSLIVARRKEDGRSGHIVAVVPETATEIARRNAAGAVIMPVQSQAGAVNFRYGLSSLNWWKDERFADSAFWVHG